MTSIPRTDPRIVMLRGERELFERAGHLFEAHEEFICAATDTSTWAMSTTHAAAKRRLRGRVRSGVAVYKLYNPATLADEAMAAQLTEAAVIGARIRIVDAPLAHETIIVDGRVAIVAGEPVDGVRGYGVIRTPEVVAGIRALFLSTWRSATDLIDYLPGAVPEVDDDGLAILRLLSAGRKDETAAREVGMSVRTYRRRVAELMTLLGAESRFQAGVRARTLGLRI